MHNTIHAFKWEVEVIRQRSNKEMDKKIMTLLIKYQQNNNNNK